jgi:transposase
MARYKPRDYAQEVLLPVSFKHQLMPGTLEFAIHTLVETRMDMSIFDSKYSNDETGRAAYDPKILLTVVLLAYSRGILSSRRIERVCRENVTFMALTCGQYPDHSTIAAFVSSMKGEILSLFRDILLVCEEEKLLGGTVFALDGCKLPSNASKEWSGTIEELKKKKERIESKVEQLLEEQLEEDKREGGSSKKGGTSEEANHEKQIEKLQKTADRIGKWLEENDAKIGRKGKEIKSNVTDNESAKMMTSHGTIQGYNGQALADKKHQVVVHGEAFGNGQDHGLVPPMIDGAKENVKEIGLPENYFKDKIFTADSDYHSATNIAKCEEEKLDAYIPDIRFRKRDKRFSNQLRQRSKGKGIFTRNDFKYMQATDQYLCPQGKVLNVNCKRQVSSGNVYRRYVSQEKDCEGCKLRGRCITKKVGRRKALMVPIGTVGTNLSKQMVAKIDTEKGRKIYAQRMAIVEPIFGNIRIQKRMDGFTLRGKDKVNIQWVLYCMVHNIEKILKYGVAYAQ